MRALGAAGAAAVLAIFAATALASGASTPTQIVAALNHERVENRIPGGITLDPASTKGCENHIRYEELNGLGWTHDETPGKPGYTKSGMLAAAQGLQANTGGWEGGDPYENLPLHLAALLQPRLDRIGAYESGVRTCVSLGVGYLRQFKKEQIFAAPGDGRRGVPSAEVVHGESPFAPGDLVGLPQGTTTGPVIYVFVVGPSTGASDVVHAHLSGPGGPVAIRVVDTTRHPQLTPYIPLGVAFLIPVAPLAHGTTYRASITMKSPDGERLTKTWRFATA
jgi:hypothetical protein